jgi:hypothetical protein
MITAGSPRVGTEHLFVLPVYAVTQVERGEGSQKLVPKPVDRDVSISFRGEGLLQPAVAVIPKGASQSDPLYLPFDPGASYSISAFAAGYQTSDPLKVEWKDFKDLLELHVEPTEVSQYATPATKADLRVYLTHEGLLVPPLKVMKIVANRPRDVFGPPTLDLSPQDSIGLWQGTRRAP